jgi:hypothetical protein
MFTRVFRIKKEAKILISRIAFVALSAVGLTLLSPVANANDYPIINGENCWIWSIDQNVDEINDMAIEPISDCNAQDDDYFLTDLYDGFGSGSVNGEEFDWNLSEDFIDQYTDENGDVIPAYIDGNEIFIPGDDSGDPATTYTVTLADNNVTYEINSTDGEDELRIWGNLGSDGYTRFITLGGHLFSYEVSSTGEYPEEDGPQNFMPMNDPILLWEISANASVTTIVEGTGEVLDTLDSLVSNADSVNVSITGDTLRLQHFAFAYQINGAADQVNFSENTDLFFTQFLNFVNEDQTRTDVFTFNWTPAPALAPAPALRQTKNLSFTKSLYGTDKLSDPDGQLRKTLDSIDVKFGSLIK